MWCDISLISRSHRFASWIHDEDSSLSCSYLSSDRDLVLKEGDSTQVSRLFYNKKLIVVVVGQMIDSQARNELLDKVMTDGWRIWLPDGSGLALGDACFECCDEELRGTQGHVEVGRKSLHTTTALPARRLSFNLARSQVFRLPGRVQQQPLLQQLSMGGKLGWKWWMTTSILDGAYHRVCALWTAESVTFVTCMVLP